MDVDAYLAERLPLVNQALDDRLPAEGEEPRSLHAAMRHLVFPGGKRLRPAFAMAAAEAAGARPEAALPAAVAVELIHTYSLVHDDLPCMDDDDERRGRPTVHVLFGEAIAVLAGDALQAKAFEVLAGAAQQAGPERTSLALRDLAKAVGAAGLVGGQFDDIDFQPQGDAAARVESVHERKSAALIAASVMTGARLAGAPATLVASLERFGLEVGLGFQIADDLLDAAADGACSLVAVSGAAAARDRAEELLGTALSRLENLGERAEPLRALARFAVRRRQ